jgi:hypothetical protein
MTFDVSSLVNFSFSNRLEVSMFHRSLLFLMIFIPGTFIIGCGGADSGTRLLDGEVQLDPDVGTDVNDPEAMQKLMNVDPTPPSQ